VTPTVASRGVVKADALVDTSVAVPLVVADHEHHLDVVDAVGDKVLGLAGYAAFETFSILTRLPPPARRSPGVVGGLIAHNFPATRFLSDHATGKLLARLGALGIAGGAVYDALVGGAAVEHGLTLFTRDRRAVDIYRRLGVTFVLVD
jgi:PIN domain-containing protein